LLSPRFIMVNKTDENSDFKFHFVGAIDTWNCRSIYVLNCRVVISFLARLEETRNLSLFENHLRSLAKVHLSNKNSDRATY
jgi:hypothetical protein